VNDRSPLVVCSSLTRLVTVTSSDMSPTCIASTPVESRSLALTTTLVRCRVLKPCRAASSVYASGRTTANTKRPSPSVTEVWMVPCVRLVRVMTTPGSAPPCSSWTLPLTEAVVVWADAPVASPTATSPASATRTRRRTSLFKAMEPLLRIDDDA
jgi:hypothetical protein